MGLKLTTKTNKHYLHNNNNKQQQHPTHQVEVVFDLGGFFHLPTDDKDGRIDEVPELAQVHLHFFLELHSDLLAANLLEVDKLHDLTKLVREESLKGYTVPSNKEQHTQVRTYVLP